jgi:hypothetical protein
MEIFGRDMLTMDRQQKSILKTDLLVLAFCIMVVVSGFILVTALPCICDSYPTLCGVVIDV